MNQPTMVHQPPLPQRRQPMGVSIGAMFFTSIEGAQAHLEREARAHLRRVAARYQQLLAEGGAQ